MTKKKVRSRIKGMLDDQRNFCLANKGHRFLQKLLYLYICKICDKYLQKYLAMIINQTYDIFLDEK